MPAIDAATARVLDALGIETLVVERSGCCGAINYHTGAPQAACTQARRNVDAWWPYIESGIEAIVVNASACAAMIKDYAHVLRDDSEYAHKASRIAERTCDLAEFLAPSAAALASLRTESVTTRVAFHPPCTLQHSQKVRGAVEALLTALGAKLLPIADAHLCCGAAGTYTLLQSKLSEQLRARKLDALLREKPDIVVSANIGCLAHLETGADVPVRHWIEWVDAHIAIGKPVQLGVHHEAIRSSID
jgi:glycolate oxidase iron-sulfur subunit